MSDEKQVRVETAYPPNYERIKLALPHANESHVYCYGDTIYAPDGHTVSADVVFHETIHTKQQGKNPDAWWNKYLTDRRFRLDQELHAYGEQYKWLRTHLIGSNSFLKWVLTNMALALSGEAYGNLIDYGKAEAAIRHYGRDA